MYSEEKSPNGNIIYYMAFSDSRYLTRVRRSKANRIYTDVDEVLAKILKYLKELYK